ncbi:alpha-amylase family protein [Pseudactinotalea sp.]|uniref:alpha-amylase family protein n=1 Tax=Pseudactinotalea sp. TaxID=1926260 RepID=UPI003B3B47C1
MSSRPTAWAEHTIWWHVYPLGAVGAPIREPDGNPGPRLLRLLPWLDHVIELGANGLLLGPVFASTSHGYDTTDFFRVDPRLGAEADLVTLIDACRERGIRVLLDGVFSHVGSEHPAVAAALDGGPDSPAGRLLDIDWDADGGPSPLVFEGHGSLARLKHDESAAVDLATEVMTYWLDRGIDGWRLDAAYSVPTEFWAAALGRVRERHPGAWFLGEVIHGDYAGFVTASTADTVTQYELWKAIWSSLLDANFFELAHALGRHQDLLVVFVPNTFVGNHDVTRIATTLGPDRAVLALAVLMTVAGIPSIYYGDELAWSGRKEERLGGDDAGRTARPDSPAEIVPDGVTRLLLDAHRALISLRRRHPWLMASRTEVLDLTNTRLRYRALGPDAHLVVTLDLENTTSAVVQDETGATLWRYDT